jgi:branched-chain amino acid transport system substrate-binding protein
MPNNINRRLFLTRASLIAGGVVAGPSLLAACGGDTGGGGETETFKVGAVLELSGESATGGQIAQRGYQLWADTVNNKSGGLNIGGTKYKVDLIVQDCKSDPATGADATSRLVTEEGVNAIFGAYTSGVQLAMDPICAKYKVPCIAGSAESPAVWKKQPAFTYGVIPAVDTTAARSIQSIVDIANPRPVRVAVVGANEPFSDDTAEGFRAGAEAAKLEVVHFSLFPPNADLAPVAQVVAGTRPVIVAVGGHDVLLVDFVKAMAATGYTPKAIIEHYGITDASFAKALARKADGIMGISVWLPTATFKDDLFGSAGDYAKAFEDQHGSPPDYTAAGCSASGLVLQAAVEKLGEKPSLSEEARGTLNDLIAGTEVTTFFGPIKFATEGDHFHNNTALDPMLVQIQGGQVKAIAPPESAQAQIIYPLAPLS